MDKFKSFVSSLPEKSKRNIVPVFCLVFVLLIITLVQIVSSDPAAEKKKKEAENEISLKIVPARIIKRSEFIEKSIEADDEKKQREEAEKSLEEAKEKLNSMINNLDKKGRETKPEKPKKLSEETNQTITVIDQSKFHNGRPAFPSTAYRRNGTPKRMVRAQNMGKAGGKPKPMYTIQYTGGMSGGFDDSSEPEITERKSPFLDSVYLPSGSFLQGRLLHGTIAPTTNAGTGKATPLLIRVLDLAILPNEFKRNVKGCFIMGEGTSELQANRIRVRLLNLSCVTENGTRVIDQRIKGYVIDQADNMRDLKAKPIAKFTPALARGFIAGVFGSIGQVLQQSNQQTSFNPLTNQPSRQISPEEAVTAGLGGGLYSSTEDLKEFYLDIAKMNLPVLEALGSKKLTIVIGEGVRLNIGDMDKFIYKDSKKKEA